MIHITEEGGRKKVGLNLYRTWVGLTEEELCEIVGVSTNDSDWNVYKVQEWLRKVEAKLKDKNTRGQE
jgi:hypothetical protein